MAAGATVAFDVWPLELHATVAVSRLQMAVNGLIWLGSGKVTLSEAAATRGRLLLIAIVMEAGAGQLNSISWFLCFHAAECEIDYIGWVMVPFPTKNIDMRNLGAWRLPSLAIDQTRL